MTIFDNLLENEFTNVPGEGPFYTSYLYQVQEDFPNIGLKSCPWNETETPKLYILKDTLIEHFNFIYRFREIGSETEERWQYTIDRVFDNIKRRYEFALNLYDDNTISAIGKVYTESVTRHGESSASDSGSSSYSSEDSGSDNHQNVFNDRPVQQLTLNGPYASAVTDDYMNYGKKNEGENSSESSKESEMDETVNLTHTDKDASTVELVNDVIDKFRDLIDDFVDEFHVCFISTLGRI